MSKMGEELEKRLDEAKYDLYEALKGLVEHYDIFLTGDDLECHIRAVDALAKAEGK